MDDRRISATDADGTALAAIQGLNEKLRRELQRKQSMIDELAQRLKSHDAQFAAFHQRLLAVESGSD